MVLRWRGFPLIGRRRQATLTASSWWAGALGMLGCLPVLLVGAYGLVAPAAEAACSNEEIRAGQGVSHLPACMAVEMVSPPKKGGQPAKWPHVSADGERVIFRSLAALGGTPGVLDVAGDRYVATRSGSGWTTEPTAPPVGFTKGWSSYAPPRSFDPHFSHWFQIAATGPQFDQGMATAYRGGLGSLFSPLSPILAPVDGGISDTVQNSQFQAASADHSHLYFRPGGSPTTSYLADDPKPTGTGAVANTYVARLGANGEPSLELLARDKSGKVWGGNCGVSLGNVVAGGRNQGAVSTDGSRVYFSSRPAQPPTGNCSESNRVRILERIETPAGPEVGQLFTSECDRASPPCDTTDGDDLYQGASIDGAKVYFMTTRQLADSDLDTALDLYLYDSTQPAGQNLIEVSAGAEAKVLSGTTAISTDGSRVYYVAEGTLATEPNPLGDLPLADQPNLYAWDATTELTVFIGTLAATDQGALWGGLGTFRNRAYPVPATGTDALGNQVGGDGHILFFQSRAALIGEDDDSGRRDIYRYDADTSGLMLVSTGSGPCAPNCSDVTTRGEFGTSPSGTDFAEDGRWVSEDGESAAFQTAESLVPGDVGNGPDSYLWREGALVRLPGIMYVSKFTGRDQPTLSHDGSVVAFQTISPLLPQDGDTTADVYVARVEGGFPLPRLHEACVPNGDSDCQGPAGAPPSEQKPSSQSLVGPGNPPDCLTPARRAQKLKLRVKRLKRNAKQAPGAPQANRLRRKARRLGKKARRLNRQAKRCRMLSPGGRR